MFFTHARPATAVVLRHLLPALVLVWGGVAGFPTLSSAQAQPPSAEALAAEAERLGPKLLRWGNTALDVAAITVQKGKNLADVSLLCLNPRGIEKPFPFNTAYCTALLQGHYRTLVANLEQALPASRPLLVEWQKYTKVTANTFVPARVEAELIDIIRLAPNAETLAPLNNLTRRSAAFLLGIKNVPHTAANSLLTLFGTPNQNNNTQADTAVEQP